MKRTLAFCLILAFIVVGLSVQAATLGTRPKSTFSDTSTTTTGPAWTYSASALTSGIGWQLTNAGSTVTGTSMDILSTGLTSGSALRIRLDNDKLTTGKYINCLGGSSYDTSVFTIGEDGATAITSAVATTNSLSITNLVSTAGDLLTLTLDNDTADADTFYISMLGGTDHATSVLTIGENGVMTFGDGGTIDGVTGTDVLNLTETTIRATGAFDVTGGFTTDTNAFAIADTTGVVTMKGGATLDNNAAETTLTVTETNIGLTGATTVTGTLDVTAAVDSPVIETTDDNTATITVGAANYGSVTFVRYTGAVAVNLAAAPAAGTWARFIVTGSDSCAPTFGVDGGDDNIITVNNQSADSVTFGSGHRIGAAVLCISNGTNWIIINEGSTTMTVTDGA